MSSIFARYVTNLEASGRSASQHYTGVVFVIYALLVNMGQIYGNLSASDFKGNSKFLLDTRISEVILNI
jgi:hypothetical protein